MFASVLSSHSTGMASSCIGVRNTALFGTSILDFVSVKRRSTAPSRVGRYTMFAELLRKGTNACGTSGGIDGRFEVLAAAGVALGVLGSALRVSGSAGAGVRF